MNINYPMDVRTITSMRNIIEQFLERQKLVAKAMLEIHPGPLQLAGTHILGIEIAPYISAWQAKLEDAHFARNWQRGIWQTEWEHYAHGTGCRLTHVHTGEPIEWDAPDLAAFDEM